MTVSIFVRQRVADYTDDLARKRYHELMAQGATVGDDSQELQALADRLGVTLKWFVVDLNGEPMKEEGR